MDERRKASESLKVCRRTTAKICAMLATLSLSGIAAPMTLNGAVDGLAFKVYVEQILCPTLSKGDIVVMDNAPGS